jgi:FixJ family two-component response regulator
MLATVVIVSRINLVRQAIAERIALLGADVREYAETSAALGILREVIPEAMVIDVEDVPWSWRPLVTELAATHRRVRIVLLARRMGIDEASEAKHLGVAGVILKPFREEEHMVRLFELLCHATGARLRRAQPRYYPESDLHSMLAMPGALSTLYRIVNISQGGACLSAAASEGLRRLEDAGEAVEARISTGGVHAGVECRVVHRDGVLTGVRFVTLTSGRSDFLEHLSGLQRRVFGSRRGRGPW